MIVTTTAIGFSLSSVGLAFCGIRFFNAFQKMGGSRAGSRIGILLSAFFLGTAAQHGVLALGSLFLAENSEALYKVLIVDHFLLAVATAIGVYLVFYILFPSVSTLPGVFVTFALGMTLVVSTITTHPRPFIDATGGIDWNMPRVLTVLLSYLILFNIGTLLSVFINSFLNAKSHEVKVISSIIITVALMGIINVFTRFLLPGNTPDFWRIRISDALIAFVGTILISTFVLPPIIIKWLSRIKSQ